LRPYDIYLLAQVDPCGICGGQSGTGAGFSSSSSVFPASIIPPLLHIQLSPPHEVCDSSDQAAHYHHLGPKLGASFLTRHFGWKQNEKESKSNDVRISSVSARNDADVNKEGAIIFRPPHNYRDTRAHVSTWCSFIRIALLLIMPSVSYIGRGTLQTVILRLLYFFL
jgi:hypothetical protein